MRQPAPQTFICMRSASLLRKGAAMAARPWVLPQEVRDYSDHVEVQNRTDTKLATDIFRAEAKVISMTHNRFDQTNSDGEEIYPVIPDQVRLAVILLAEAYAFNVARKAAVKKKSETFDDYAYEAAETTDIDMSGLDLDELLSDYVISERGSVNLRMMAL